MGAELLALAALHPLSSRFAGGVRYCAYEAATLEEAVDLRRRVESIGKFKATIREL